VTGDLNLAEDVASEAFYAAFENLQDLNDTQRFGPWLRTIVIRTASRYKAKKSKEDRVDLQTLPDAQIPAPSANLEQQELVVLVHEAIESLSETLRESIALFYFEGYSVEDAAHFLDIPVGTLKRRLYDGRNRLNSVAETILKGKKPMNLQREEALKRFKEVIDKDLNSVDSREILQQVLQLRPLPHELIAKFLQHRSKASKKMATVKGREEMVCKTREMYERLYQPSQKVLDPDHVVGKVARAIRKSLPEFKEWHVDASKAAQKLVRIVSGNFESFNLPPGFDKGTPGSYIYTAKVSLVPTKDGSMWTMYDLIKNKEAKDLNDKEFISNGRLSDVLALMWMRSNTIELREVEELLRRLSELIVPQVTTCFLAYEEPRYRSALRMKFENITIPAAIGGPLNAWPNMPEGVTAASVQIFLESWATAQSGKVVKLAELSPLLDLPKNKSDQAE
jgi:RNA polymerase sigma factor (sigma-70 family)